MSKHRSTLFNDLKGQTASDYADTRWLSSKRWLRRVGLTRLVAERAANEASGLFQSIHLSIHRNEPDLRKLLEVAREAADAYTEALMRDNWRRFEGRPK